MKKDICDEFYTFQNDLLAENFRWVVNVLNSYRIVQLWLRSMNEKFKMLKHLLSDTVLLKRGFCFSICSFFNSNGNSIRRKRLWIIIAVF